MAWARQYKNVYTILEKVKKGEIKTYYKEREGLFGKLNFYKKADLIKPYVHYIDEHKIDSIVEAGIMDQNKIKQEFNYFTKTSAFHKIPEDKRPNLDKYFTKIRENLTKFPKHLKYDIFKMYYNKMDKLNFEERTDKNHTRYKFLEKANNPVGKIMTEGGNLKSAIFTRNMIMYYLMQMTQLEYIDEDTAKNLQKGLDGNSEFYNKDADDALDKMLDNQASKNALDRAMKDAEESCKTMDEFMTPDMQERLFDEATKSSNSTGEASKLDKEYIRKIAANLSNIKMSMNSLKDKIKKLLNRSNSYFSARKITTYNDLFNTENIHGLEDYELLHPKLRKILTEDVQIKDTKTIGKIDVYVDISGSMSNNCGCYDTKGDSISRINFAKSMLAKLQEMDMLNEIYLFDTRIQKCKNNMLSISMIDCNGGTNINKVVNNIIINNRNAIVITDAEDNCDKFCQKAFFIGLNGARFNMFNHDVIKQYSENGQVIIFDGNLIYNVNKNGMQIK